MIADCKFPEKDIFYSAQIKEIMFVSLSYRRCFVYMYYHLLTLVSPIDILVTGTAYPSGHTNGFQ